MSCIVAIKWILIWNKLKQDHSFRLKQWLKQYEIAILFLTLFGGFYSTIDICRSKLFYLPIFSFPLKHSEVNSPILIYLRLINFVVLEKLRCLFFCH